MSVFVWGRTRFQQIAAELADVLEQGAVPADNVIPKSPRGKFFSENDRPAGNQHAARRHDAADAVIDRQAVIHAIVRRRVYQTGEPASPVQNATMAYARCLGHAGGAGSK